MELFIDFCVRLLTQFQSITLAFLIGGMLLAAFKSKLSIPNAIYEFIVFMLLVKIGIEGGIEIRQANFATMFFPAVLSVLIGLLTVFIGVLFFSFIPSVKKVDGIATAGLFGAVSASTLAAGMVALEDQSVSFEAWVPALYPFMDIPALIIAIVLANIYLKKQSGSERKEIKVWGIIKNSLRGSALSALIFGLILGLLTKSEGVLHSFYQPLFKGFLSILMLIMGMEAYARINELRRVAHWFVVYAIFAPVLHGLLAFGLGYIAHITVGFSPGGVILLSVIAASNSDISGPPTLRAGIPSANPSTYLGSSTSIGTPVAIVICIPLFIALGKLVFNI